jgi:hypothetical protein
MNPGAVSEPPPQVERRRDRDADPLEAHEMKKIVGVGYGALLLALALAATSCMTVRYNYGGRQYDRAADALAAQEQTQNALLAEIAASSQPLNVPLIVLIPTDEYIAANWVKISGDLGVHRDEVVAFTAQSLKSTILYSAEAIKKRRSFDTVIVRQCAKPEAEAFSEPVALYVPTGEKADWWMKGKNPGAQGPIALEAMAPTLSPLQRINILLDQIEANARKLK